MAHGPGSPMPYREARQYGTYVTPAAAQAMSPANVRPVKTQQAQTASAVPTQEWAPVQKQRLLRSMGYAIDVDGSWGPQSEMAWQAYQKGVPPQYWNKNSARSNAFTPPSMRGKHDPAADPASPGVSENSPAAKGKLSPAAAKAAQSTEPLLDTLLKRLQSFQFINPEQAAAAMTAAQFDPQEANLQRQIAENQANGTQSLSDIGNWYKQVLDAQSGALTSNQTAYGTAASALTNAGSGIAAALGGSANPGVSDAGSIASNYANLLTSLGQNQSSFDRDMGGILAAQEADRKNARQNAIDQQDFNLNQNLSDILGQRAQTLAANKATEQNAYLGQLGQYQNLLLGSIMAPGQLALQGAQLAGQNLTNAGKSIQNRSAKAQLQQFINTYIKNGGSAAPAFTQLDPGTLGKMNNMAIGAVQNAVMMNHSTPQQAYNLVGTLLSQLSGGKWNANADPSVDAFRWRLLKQVFTAKQLKSIPGYKKYSKNS